MSWTYDSVLPPESAATEPVVQTQAAPAETAVLPAAGTATMTQDEIAQVGAMIQSYSGYPGVSSAFASMVSANSSNPERLAALVREMVDQIEQVKSNPHVHHPVNPEIAGAIEAIRKAELEKPDPLNLLRNNDSQSHSSESFQAAAWAGIGALAGLNFLHDEHSKHPDSVIKISPNGDISYISTEDFERMKASGQLRRLNPEEAEQMLGGMTHFHTTSYTGPDGKPMSPDQITEFERMKASGEIYPISTEEYEHMKATGSFKQHGVSGANQQTYGNGVLSLSAEAGIMNAIAAGQTHGHITTSYTGPDGKPMTPEQISEFERMKASGEIWPISTEEAEKIKASHLAPAHATDANPKHENPQHQSGVDGVTADRMHYKDLGDTGAYIASLGSTGFVPSQTPNVAANAPSKGRT